MPPTTNHLAGDAATLSAWKRDRRLRLKRPRTDAVAAEPEVSEVPPAPAEADASKAPTEQAA